MNYKKIECKEYNIHIIKNNNFHTIDFRVCFTENVTKEKITYRNFLINMLTYATKKYDTREKLLKKCQDLYSISPVASSVRNGRLLSSKFGISTISSKYIDEDNLYDSILLLKEIILNPLISNKEFNNKYFKVVKHELESETKTIPEEPRLYANIKLFDLLSTDECQILSGYSDLDVLNKINPKNLYNSYLELLETSKIDIFISGNISDSSKIVDFIQKNFSFNNHCQGIKDGINIHKVKNKEQIYEEKMNYQQSKLSIGYKLFNPSVYENRYVGFVFNSLFGGSFNSLLMRYVRENESLCYYINSYYNRLDNILIVNSGINKMNYIKVLDLQKNIFNRIKNGKFTEKDLHNAKKELLFELSNIYESNRNIIDYYYGRCIFKSDDIEYKKKMIESVTKEDIKKFVSKLSLDTVFFLKGDL